MTPPFQVIRTEDGSPTLFSEELNQGYHSVYGAVTEARHIFIEAGFRFAVDHFYRLPDNKVNAPVNSLHEWLSEKLFELKVLEAGFGTGLNALLTFREASRSGMRVRYDALEAFPLSEKVWQQLAYPEECEAVPRINAFQTIHQAPWDRESAISDFFLLHKIHKKLEDFEPGKEQYHLVCFDAFSPETQPELWHPDIFSKLAESMKEGAVLVTYSSKGTVKQALRQAGLRVERLGGPPGKRHMIRAHKS